jgi:hypothetical protein
MPGSSTNAGNSGSGSGNDMTETPDVPTQADEGATPIAAPEVVNVDDLEDDSEEEEDEDQAQLTGKRRKKCTSFVWKYFTKKLEVVEVNGVIFVQLWGYCNFPKCKKRYRAEGCNGTTGFKNRSPNIVFQEDNNNSKLVRTLVLKLFMFSPTNMILKLVCRS